jgi:hypothetical protein
MQYNTNKQWTIEPKLQEFIDRKMVIAKATFAKDADEQMLRNTMLLECAGLGFAKAENKIGGIMWVRTELLAELEKGPTRPFDLTPFMATANTEGDKLPSMTDSLQLIIADMVAQGEQPDAGWTKQNASDAVLLMLAGQGLAATATDQAGNWIWCANPALVDGYQMGGGKRKPKLIVDETLKGIQKALTQLVEVEIGCKVPKQMKRMSAIMTLIQQELIGDAVAYKDSKGRIAWKASAKLQREQNPEPEAIA